MAYNAYQPRQYQHPTHYQHPQSYSHGPAQYAPAAPTYANTSSVPLKPLPQATTTSTPAGTSASYTPIDPNSALARLDAKHKRRIRVLKALSRILATLLSLATFIPLAMTLIKFFQTRNETMVVDGEERTAWASGTVTWYTYLYFGVASISLLLNAGVLASYCCCGGHRGAEKVARFEGWWANLQRGLEVLVWVASVAIYRYGKEPDVEGKFKDLWGWTCSPAAEAIQAQITNVDFAKYCTVQVSLRRACH